MIPQQRSTDLETAGLATVDEFAQELRLRTSTIRKWLLLRRLAFHKIGRRTLIPRSEIQRILEQGFVPARDDR